MPVREYSLHRRLVARPGEVGFADEIFRFFQQRHPAIKIIAINIVEPVQFMIDRLKKPTQT